MKPDNLDNIWNEATTAGRRTDEAFRLVQKERAKDRRRNIRMGFFGFNLAMATVLGVWGTVSGNSQLAESWPAAVSLIVLWATYVEFIRIRMNETARYQSMSKDLRSALQLTFDKATTCSREFKILLAVNILIVIPLTVLSVQNLMGSDKMTGSQALSFAIFSAFIFGANIVFLSVQFFTKLRPQCDLLQKRIQSLEA